MQGIDEAQRDLARMQKPWLLNLGLSEKPKTKSGKGTKKHYLEEDKATAGCMIQNQLSRLANAYNEIETYREAIETRQNKTRTNYRKLEECAHTLNKELTNTVNRIHAWIMAFDELPLATISTTIGDLTIAINGADPKTEAANSISTLTTKVYERISNAN